MTTYIVFRSIRSVPKFRDALVYLFDESFRTRPYCGFGQPHKNGRPQYAHFHWAVWEDNPGVEPVVNLWILFLPFKPKPPKIVISASRKLQFPNVAKIVLEQREAPTMSQRAFRRLVYKYLIDTKGVSYDTSTKRFVGAEDYYAEYRTLIERKFHLKVRGNDLRIPR